MGPKVSETPCHVVPSRDLRGRALPHAHARTALPVGHVQVERAVRARRLRAIFVVDARVLRRVASVPHDPGIRAAATGGGRAIPFHTAISVDLAIALREAHVRGADARIAFAHANTDAVTIALAHIVAARVGPDARPRCTTSVSPLRALCMRSARRARVASYVARLSDRSRAVT